MSVKSKMTAIANLMRSLMGTSEAMTLDDMETALGTQRTYVTASFEAVAEMGGLMPPAPLLADLPGSIRTIRTGVKVKKFNGTFTTSTSGTATVNCGFKPDLVVVKVGKDPLGFDTAQNDPAFAFTESGQTKLSITSVPKSSAYIYMNASCTQSSSGFSIIMNNISNSFETGPVSRTTFSYIAVKYTE